MPDSKLRTSLLTLGLIGVAALGFMWWQQKSVSVQQDPEISSKTKEWVGKDRRRAG